nr:iron ABC transporter permease [Tianweitania sediminis]
MGAFRPSGLLLDPGLTLDNVRRVYFNSEIWSLAWTTARFALGSTFVGLIVGALFAWMIERTDVPLAGFFRGAFIAQMAVPPFLLAMGWTILLSPRSGLLNAIGAQVFGPGFTPFNIYSITGMIFVEGIALAPSAFLLLGPAFRNLDPNMEEAARMSGAGSLEVFRKVTLPLLAPALLGATIFLTIVSFVVFDVPGILGMPSRIWVLSSRIYSLAHESPNGLPDYGAISAIAMMFILALLIAAYIYQKIIRGSSRYVTVTGKSFRHRRTALGAWRLPVALLGSVYLFVCICLPILMVVLASLQPFMMRPSAAALTNLSLQNYAQIFGDAHIVRAMVNSFVIAGVTSFGVLVIAFACSWAISRSQLPGIVRRILDVFTLIPLAIPGIILGTALIYLYLALGFLGIYGTIWIIVIAHTTNYLSFGVRSINSVLSQMHPELEEAALVAGSDRANAVRAIIVPLAAPALVATWFWVFSHSIRELTQALMLQSVGNATLTTTLFGYWSSGEPNKAAAVGISLFAVVLLAVLAWAAATLRFRK